MSTTFYSSQETVIEDRKAHLEELAKKDAALIAKALAYNPACPVCQLHTWEVGATISASVVDPVEQETRLIGHGKIMIQIVCSTCQYVWLLNAGDANPVPLTDD